MAEEKPATAKNSSDGSAFTGKYRHSLEGHLFQEALERYVDENKPDPLVLKQIQGWEMEWSSNSSKEDAENMTAELNFVPTDSLQGTLTWKSDYMVADITAFCCWEPHSEDKEPTKSAGAKGNNKEGSFYFLLKAALRFRTKHDKAKSKDKGDKTNNKSEDKIRSKMIQRLRDDTFIKKLLKPETSSTNTDSNSQETSVVLCEARVSIRTSPKEGEPEQLEERVDVTDPVAEGLRRALFSQAESSLDVVELLLSLPILPGSLHSNLTFQCPLADRAKLRLLEDSMFDACEREGEDELIDDLNISPATAAETDDDPPSKAGKPGPSKHPKSKPSAGGRSSKRTKR